MTFEVQLLLAASMFVASGVTYSLAGYKAKVYSFLSGDPDVKFDLKRISKKIGLGIFLGMAVFVTEELINGNETVDLLNPGVFVKQAVFQMGAIYAMDMLMFKGRGGTKVSGGKVGDLPPYIPLADPAEAHGEQEPDIAMIADDALDPPVMTSAPPPKEVS